MRFEVGARTYEFFVRFLEQPLLFGAEAQIVHLFIDHEDAVELPRHAEPEIVSHQQQELQPAAIGLPQRSGQFGVGEFTAGSGSRF